MGKKGTIDLSTSFEIGYKRGREYLRRCPIEKVTFEQYKQLGKVDVRLQYKHKKAQDQYLLGWWHAGEQFATLFKTDDDETYSALKRVKSLQQRLESAIPTFEGLLEFRQDDTVLQETLSKASDAFNEVLECLDRASEYLDKS